MPGEISLAFGRVGEGPEPVLALHGITAQHRAFNALARHFQYPDGMVALDLRGRGDSAKPPSGSYGLAAHAEDVIRTLDHLRVEKGILAGHSSGAFVALRTALSYPERVRAIVLVDGGWPRPEEPSEPGEQIQQGLERAFRRLDMVFETPEDYLDYWFPDQNLTLEDLPPDLADYYLYDLERVEGGYTPKASREAAEEDAESSLFESPTAAELRGVGCPVALVRAAEGFFPGYDPLVSDEARDAMAEALDLRSERLLSGANHYTVLLSEEYARQIADIVRDFLQKI
ncbi:MAG: alpha/beta hydrolase [Actinomycetota bacterium]|nr:alpha/beta hydrolase [Actinomycetota bacterium]